MPAQNNGLEQPPARGPLARARGVLKRFTLLRLVYRFLFRLGIGEIIVRRPVFHLLRACGLRVLKREDLRRAAAEFHLVEYGGEESITEGEPLSADPVSDDRHPFKRGALSDRVAPVHGLRPERCVEWNGSRLEVGTLVVSSFRRA